MGLYIRVLLVLCMLLVMGACDKDGSITGPDGGGGTSSLAIVVLTNGYISQDWHRSIIRITGGNIDTTLTSQSLSSSFVQGFRQRIERFSITGIPAGTYTIEPSADDNSDIGIMPSTRTVTVSSGETNIDPFVGLTPSFAAVHTNTEAGVVFGRILCDDDVLRLPFHLYLTTPDGVVIESTREVVNDMYCFTGVARGTYRVTPQLDAFVFDPPFFTVTLDSLSAMANFSASYIGPELHTIKCRILSDAKEYEANLLVRIDTMQIQSITVKADENGYIETPPLQPGTYYVTLYCTPFQMNFERTMLQVMIVGNDVDLGEHILRYQGPMHYQILGKVTDESGNALQDATITLQGSPLTIPKSNTATTNLFGIYNFSGDAYYTIGEDLGMTLRAEYPGLMMNPSVINLVHPYEELLPLVTFVADFTGSPTTIMPYFPLVSSASWTYTHIVDGVSSGQITIEAGTAFEAGGQTWIPLDGLYVSAFDGYRVEGAAMYAWTGVEEVTWAALDYLSWDIGMIWGQRAAGERLDPEVATVPAGTFMDCQVIRIIIPPNSPSAETTTFWLAEGIGPVKIEYEAMSAGAVIQRITEELVSYQVP